MLLIIKIDAGELSPPEADFLYHRVRQHVTL